MNSADYLDYQNYEKFIFILRKDGIVHYKIKKDSMILLMDIMEHYRYFEKKYPGQQFLNIYEFEENAEIDDDARKWASDPDGNTFTIADAFVIQSMAQKLVGNFYLTFHKPIKPTRLFNRVDDAIEWLKTFSKK